MNFIDVFRALYEETDILVVYAKQAYNYIKGDSVPCIGIRANFVDHKDNDPCIDGIDFMVAGTIYNRKGEEVMHLEEFMNMFMKEATVQLRAIPGMVCMHTEINLGEFEIDYKGYNKHGDVTLLLHRR